MAETRLTLEPEVQEIFRCIDAKRNFLLSGGAGSGKTFSLVQTIRQVISENPTSDVACMTYTNAAVREIAQRIGHGNLTVTTIHEFLWNNVKHFQNELKAALTALANDSAVTGIKMVDITHVPEGYFDTIEDGIQYKEYLQLAKGIISHDELLIVADYMFEKYPKLCDVVKDKFRFIFVDEYQDTDKAVIRIFLEHFRQSSRQNIVGFFGDAMQSIYDGIGNLDAYKSDGVGSVMEIKKNKNRRNPKLIIDLANRLRTDGIVQVPSTDAGAPNMSADGQVINGTLKFLYSDNPDIQQARAYLASKLDWDFKDSKETKELNLTHNLIADKAGFRTLMDIYDKERILELKGKIVKKTKDDDILISDNATFGEVMDKVAIPVGETSVIGKFIAERPDLMAKARSYLFSDFRRIYANKDQLLDDKKQDKDDENKPKSQRDNLIRHLFKIQNNIQLYQGKKYNEFIRTTDFKISDIGDKTRLRDSIDTVTNVEGKTIGQIIALAHETGICMIDDNLSRFKTANEYLYDRIKEVRFLEFQNLFAYLEGHTPFSTQHKTKGDEFDNVLLILDSGSWNLYNFGYLFTNSGNPNVLERTRKIFYVCCTRAKDSLAVFFHKPPPEVIAKAREWFGMENVISLP